MTKLCIGLGTFAGGYVGGYLASGLGFMGQLLASGVGSMVGVFVGWKLARWIEHWTES